MSLIKKSQQTSGKLIRRNDSESVLQADQVTYGMTTNMFGLLAREALKVSNKGFVIKRIPLCAKS